MTCGKYGFKYLGKYYYTLIDFACYSDVGKKLHNEFRTAKQNGLLDIWRNKLINIRVSDCAIDDNYEPGEEWFYNIKDLFYHLFEDGFVNYIGYDKDGGKKDISFLYIADLDEEVLLMVCDGYDKSVVRDNYNSDYEFKLMRNLWYRDMNDINYDEYIKLISFSSFYK